MNRVLLCGVCVGALKSLLGEEDEVVTVYTSSDGTTKQNISLELCEEGKARLTHDGLLYEAVATDSEQSGITLQDGDLLMKDAPGLVTLLMQNMARCLTEEGVSVSFSVKMTEKNSK